MGPIVQLSYCAASARISIKSATNMPMRNELLNVCVKNWLRSILDYTLIGLIIGKAIVFIGLIVKPNLHNFLVLYG